MLDHIQPIVLVGGRARRFGRDKLREPIDAAGAEWLVDRPIGALRAVFGPRIAAVGECDPEVAARFDLMIPDAHPGTGPLGGVLSALQHTNMDVCVLPGDLPDIRPEDIRVILGAAERFPSALAVLANAGGLQPCIGLYRADAASYLDAALRHGQRALHAALPETLTIRVPIPPAHARNINAPADLA